MKNRTIRLGFGLIIILLSSFILIGCSTSSSQKKERDIFVISESKKENLITDVKKDIRLVILSEDKVSIEELIVFDNTLTAVKTNNVLDGELIYINAPESGYIEGQTYSITLPANCRFSDADLSDTRTLFFTIAKKNTEKVTYAKKITNISTKEIKDQTENTVTTVNTLTLEKDDIVTIPDPNFAKVKNTYKVSSVESSNGSQVITLSEPKLDEVYSELEIFKTMKIDGTNIEVHEDEIVSFVKSSTLLDSFFTDVSASDEKQWSIKVKPTKEGVEIRVKYSPATVKPDGTKVFGSIAVEVTLIYKPTVQINIQSLDQMQMKFTNTIAIKLGFSPAVGNSYDVNDLLSRLDKNDYTADEIKKSINDLNRDITEQDPFKYSSLNLFSLKIPIQGSINFFMDCGFDYSFNPLSVSLESNVGYVLSNTVGIIKNGASFVPFYDINDDNKSGDLKLTGSVSLKADLKISGGVELVPGTRAGFELSAGPYAELEGFSKVSNLFDFKTYEGFVDAEAGFQYELTAFFKANLILKKISFELVLGSGKMPILEYANNYVVEKISLPEYIRVKDNSFKLDSLLISYKDIFKESAFNKVIKRESFMVDLNGTELLKASEGFLVEQFTEGENDVTIRWAYKGKDYYSTKKMLITNKPYRLISTLGIEAQEIESYDNKVSMIKRNNKYGLIDYSGKVVLDIKYLGFTHNYDGELGVVTNEGSFLLNKNYAVTDWPIGWGIEGWSEYVYERSSKTVYRYDIDTTGSNVLMPVGNGPGRIEVASEVVFTNEYDSWTGQYKVSYTGKKGLINGSGRIVVLPTYDKLYFAGSGLYAAKKNGKWGYIDKNGKIIIEIKYQATQPEVETSEEYISESVRYESGGFIVVMINNKYGLINLKGEEILPFSFDNISDVIEGKMWLKEGTTWSSVQLLK